ncbi:hypothetical protein F5J12DRAFT_831130 [Pisolithus orientalis]|uniref:uncharacterized protein n=1 Tax=Pisolithus orientalis TaxID=936130 RepID=UPI002225B6A9|nr:uncharacterized protein F5J12DRAFT_831130 [Pisolithus orientalis]KAI6006506.1 hypothetical protein F5J12DRAFT_831130 [Pisolithus orientalis]
MVHSWRILVRTRRLLNALIIYAVNRCLLTLSIEIVELVMIIFRQDALAMGFSFIIGKLYTNSALASLNTREYLRSLGSSSGIAPDLRMSTIRLANLPKPSGNVKDSKNGDRHFKAREATVMDITVVATLDKTTTL